MLTVTALLRPLLHDIPIVAKGRISVGPRASKNLQVAPIHGTPVRVSGVGALSVNRHQREGKQKNGERRQAQPDPVRTHARHVIDLRVAQRKEE